MYCKMYHFSRRYFWPEGKKFYDLYNSLKNSEWLSVAELENIQLAKIQKLVNYAYSNVPFYNKLYRENDIHPGDIKSFNDFNKLPFIKRGDIKSNLDKFLSHSYPGKYYTDHTGGSTGEPMKFYMDRSSAIWSSAVQARYRSWYGIKPGDKRAWVWGALKDFPDWSYKKKIKSYLNRYRYLNAHNLSERNMKMFAEMLTKWKPSMFRAYPSAMSLFGLYLKSNNITNIRPKLIETSAEKLFKPQREILNEVFQCPIAEHYGSWEIYDIGYQCEYQKMHISEDRYLGVVDENENKIQNGRSGNVVITSLTQYAMPFIRYLNGDVGTLDENQCNCGRGLPVLKRIDGRTTDLLYNTDGNVVSGSAINYLLKDKKSILQFRIHQYNLENIEIKIICNKSVDKDWEEKIKKKFKGIFGQKMNITIAIVKRIELTKSGKLKTITSDIKNVFW